MFLKGDYHEKMKKIYAIVDVTREAICQFDLWRSENNDYRKNDWFTLLASRYSRLHPSCLPLCFVFSPINKYTRLITKHHAGADVTKYTYLYMRHSSCAREELHNDAESERERKHCARWINLWSTSSHLWNYKCQLFSSSSLSLSLSPFIHVQVISSGFYSIQSGGEQQQQCWETWINLRMCTSSEEKLFTARDAHIWKCNSYERKR